MVLVCFWMVWTAYGDGSAWDAEGDRLAVVLLRVCAKYVFCTTLLTSLGSGFIKRDCFPFHNVLDLLCHLRASRGGVYKRPPAVTSRDRHFLWRAGYRGPEGTTDVTSTCAPIIGLGDLSKDEVFLLPLSLCFEESAGGQRHVTRVLHPLCLFLYGSYVLTSLQAWMLHLF